MVVRNKMSQYEQAEAPSVAPAWIAGPVPMDVSREDIDSARLMIDAGQAFLKVVEYPWGVEFGFFKVEGPR